MGATSTLLRRGASESITPPPSIYMIGLKILRLIQELSQVRLDLIDLNQRLFCVLGRCEGGRE